MAILVPGKCHKYIVQALKLNKWHTVSTINFKVAWRLETVSALSNVVPYFGLGTRLGDYPGLINRSPVQLAYWPQWHYLLINDPPPSEYVPKTSNKTQPSSVFAQPDIIRRALW